MPLSSSMPSRSSIPLVIVTLVLLLAPLAARAVQTVELPADPPARRSVALEEVWHIGSEDEDVLLGLVGSGVLDDDGNVLLADQQLSHVVVVTPDGEVLDTLGRDGDGPGELRNLMGVFTVGDRVGLIQSYPGKVVYVDRQGVPAGGFALSGEPEDGGAFAIRDLCCVGDVLVGCTDRSSYDAETDKCVTRASLSVMDPEGVPSAELVTHEVARGARHIVMDEAASWSSFTAWAAGKHGRVATVAERDAWAVNEYDLSGALQRVLRRPYQLRKRTDEEKEEAVSSIVLSMVIGQPTIEKKPLDTDPAIVGLDYAADGSLLVTTCRQAPAQLEAGVAGRYDVITPDGRFREELTLTFPGFDPEQDRLVFLDGVHYLIVRNYEDAEAAIYAAFMTEEQLEELGEIEPLEVVLARVAD